VYGIVDEERGDERAGVEEDQPPIAGDEQRSLAREKAEGGPPPNERRYADTPPHPVEAHAAQEARVPPEATRCHMEDQRGAENQPERQGDEQSFSMCRHLHAQRGTAPHPEQAVRRPNRR